MTAPNPPSEPWATKTGSLDPKGPLTGSQDPGRPLTSPQDPKPPLTRSTASTANPSSLRLKSAIFRQSRQKSWERLDELVTRLDSKGLKSLSATEAMDLPLLYQTAVSSLSLARHMVLDNSLVAYLENLVLRGHLAVYGPRRTLNEVGRDFFARDFPRAVRALKLPLLIAFLAFFSGVAAGFFQVQADETSFYSIVDDSIAQNRGPKSSVESLRNSVYSPWSGFEKSFIVFAGYLFRHNSFIAFLCFGLGFALGVPTVILLFQNGQMVGAFFAIHYAKGLGLDFFAWLAIHGVTEISAILIAGAAGIGVAERIFLPGERTRRENLAKEGPTVAAAMVGAVFMLMIAGILEGGFRQYFGSIFPRLLVAALTLYGWLYYFLSFGHEDEG